MFRFKSFSIDDSLCAMKVGTDAVLLGSWVDVSGVGDIVDAGCGSGVISLMMAQRAPEARIIAVDIDKDACECCRANAVSSPWKSRVEVVCDDITQMFPLIGSPLLIVSNPPFFNEPLRSPDSGRALARHGDTFDIKSLIEISARFLQHENDSLAFISPAGRKDEIEWLLACARMLPARLTTVYPKKGKPAIRLLWQVVRESGSNTPCRIEDLFIRDADNNYSADYKALTSQFYLDY